MNPATASRGGFIALMSAIIVSLILMALLTTLSLTGYFGRFNVLSSEFKERGFALAEACASAAVIKLGQDPGYAGNETLTFGSATCRIFAVETSGSQKIIKTRAIYQNTYSNLKLTVNPTTLATTAFEEVATLP